MASRSQELERALVARVGPAVEEAFRESLPAWFDGVRRPMPWREGGADGRRDPYRVWVSEVMLQQTRVETATPYFERFVEAFPTVAALAAAPQDRVLKLWEGLGYYSRARNLHRAAGVVVAEHGGAVPDTEAAFRALPGVGPYTAAAVLSLAFGRPLAVLDGNVIRVLTRVFAVEADAKAGPTRRALQTLADQLLDTDDPGRFNEAVMELGALLCTPRSPNCPNCPLNGVCAAYAEGAPERYPVTSKAKPVPHHTVVVAVAADGAGRLLIQRRPEDAMLGGLWEFPGGKQEPGETLAETCRREVREELGVEVEVGRALARVEHAYSHFRITLHAFRCRLAGGEPVSASGEPIRWVQPESLDDYAFPRANRRVIEALQAEVRQPRLL
ncbi:A/G-specific adenine glycosylase [Rubrivirga sp. S365]|uniref:Adenine DNA glycosylase n=1 Tax=Rubrivirga litoralis TaxID=3075598 RepID=A0ABU3BMI9_9BACT|nr:MULTISPECIES: A/G-specific adenine glycosylase [unclassified Rubrivirga]MDT0630512.1 A/G-specific adenine glycosylase [Rubrivirga sp. F394]MDT7856873.1 A/G-specific adenine glycosylase [Rubrivirga sp. S365]